MIVDSTNPRIMADNIRELARNGGGGGSDLPDPSEANDGQVLMVDDGEWGIGDIPNELPDVSSEDSGEVLMVSDDGEWEAAELTGLLPEVDSSDSGEVLMVSNDGEWEAAELPSSESLVKKVAIRTVSASTQSAIVSINGVEYSYTSQDLPVTVDGLTLEYLSNDFKWKVSSTKNVIYSGVLTASLDDEWTYNETHNVDYYVFN